MGILGIVVAIFLIVWAATAILSTLLVCLQPSAGSGNIGVIAIGWGWPFLLALWAYHDVQDRFRSVK